MTTFVSLRAFKVVAAASAVPALSLSSFLSRKPVLAEERKNPEAPVKTVVYKARDLPLYEHREQERGLPPVEMYPRNSTEEFIATGRKNLWEMATMIMSQLEVVGDKVNIGVEHTKVTLYNVQNNSAELPRILSICVAAMGGVVLGYRGGPMRKLVYSSVLTGSTAALCYPHFTMELARDCRLHLDKAWEDVGGKAVVDQYWPFGEKKDEVQPTLPAPVVQELSVKRVVKTDEGQSNPQDSDMYSTRGS